MTDGVIDREREERLLREMDKYSKSTTPDVSPNAVSNPSKQTKSATPSTAKHANLQAKPTKQTDATQEKSKEKSDPYTFSKKDRSELVSMNIAEYLNLKRDLFTIDEQMDLQESKKETGTDEYKANKQKRQDLRNIAGMKAFSVIANCLEQFEGVDENGNKLTDEQKDPKNRKLTRTEAIESKFADFREALRKLNSLDKNELLTEAYKHNKREEIIDNFIESLGDFADSYIAVGNEKIVLKDFIRSSIGEVKDFIVYSKVDNYVCDILNPTTGLVKNKGANLKKVGDYMAIRDKLGSGEKGFVSYMLYGHQTLQQWRQKVLEDKRYKEYLVGKDGILKKNEKLTEDNTKTIVLGSAGVGGSMIVASLSVFPMALIVALVAYCSYANKDKNPLGSAVDNLKEQVKEFVEGVNDGLKAFSTDVNEEKKKNIDKSIGTFLSEKEEKIDKLVEALKNTGTNKFGDSLSSEQIKILDRLQKVYMECALDKPEYAHLLNSSDRSVSIPQIPLTNEQIKDVVFRIMQKKNIPFKNNSNNSTSSTQADDDIWQAKNRSRQQASSGSIRTTSFNA